jgi:tetratricopeptide (TPR) repeat protein
MENKRKSMKEVLNLIKEKSYELDFDIDVPDELKGNTDVIKCILEYGNLDFEKLPDAVKNQKQLLTLIAEEKSYEFENFPDWAKDDKDIVLTAISKSYNAFEHASERLRSEREVVIAAFTAQSTYNTIQFVASEELQNDVDILKLAIKSHNQAFGYIPEKWRTNKELIELVLAGEVSSSSFELFPLEYRDNEEIAKKVVRDEAGCFQYLSERLRNNKEIAIIAASGSWYALGEMPDAMLDDKDVVLSAVQNQDVGGHIEKISDRLKKDIEIVIASVLKDNSSLEYFPDEFKNDNKVIEACLKGNGSAYKYFSERFKNDRNIALQMSAKYNFDLSAAPEIFRSDKEIVKNAVKENDYNYQYIGKELLSDLDYLRELYIINDRILSRMDEEIKTKLFTTTIESVEHYGRKIIYEMVIDKHSVQNYQRPVKVGFVQKDDAKVVHCENFPFLTYEDDGPVGSYLSYRYLCNFLLCGNFVLFIKENSGGQTLTHHLSKKDDGYGPGPQASDDFLKHEVYLIPESITKFSYDNLDVLPRLYFGRTDYLPNGIKLFSDYNSYSEALTILNQESIHVKSKFKKINDQTLEVIPDGSDEIFGAARVFVDGYGWRFLIPHEEGALKALEVLKSTTINDDLNWIKNKDWQSAIFRASENGYLETLQFLLKDIDEKIKPIINNALIKATAKNYSEIVKELIHAGADVNSSDSYGDTALIWACSNDNTEVVELLLKANTNVNYKNKDKSAINYCKNDGVKILKLLINSGCDIENLDNSRIVECYENIAMSYKNEGEYLKAINYFERVLEKEKRGGPLVEMGECYELLNDKENALKSFTKCAEVRLDRLGKEDNRTLQMATKSLDLAKELNLVHTLPEWIKIQ